MAELLYGVSRHDLRPDIYPREHLVDVGGCGRIFGSDQHRVNGRMASSGEVFAK